MHIPRPGDRHALLIGNGTYSDPGIRDLTGPSVDAPALESVLNETGGFKTQLCLNENCSQLHNELVSFFANKNPEDVLLLYISGHGKTVGLDDQLCFPVINTNLDNVTDTALFAADISILMNNSRSCNQILILDCCYSAHFFGHGPPNVPGLITRDLFGGSGTVILASSSNLAFESEDEGGLGVFTKFLVEGIRTGAAARWECDIDHVNLFEYARSKTKAERPSMEPRKWELFNHRPIVVAKNFHFIPATTVSLMEQSLWHRHGSGEYTHPLEWETIHNINKGMSFEEASSKARDDWDKAPEWTNQSRIGCAVLLIGMTAITFVLWLITDFLTRWLESLFR